MEQCGDTGSVLPQSGTPPLESDSRLAGALVTGIFDPHPARRRGVRSTAGRRQVHERPLSGLRGAVSLSRGLARGRARRSWPRVSGAGGQSPAGHVRLPSVPAEPPAAGFTCLPSGPCSPAAGQSATSCGFAFTGA